MSIYLEPYQTTFGSLLNVEKIKKELLDVFYMEENLKKMNLGVFGTSDYKCVFLTGAYPVEKDVSLFDHPVTVTADDVNYIVTDIRHITKNQNKLTTDTISINDYIKDIGLFKFYLYRAVMMATTLQDKNTSKINSLGDLPMLVYGGMFGFLLSTRLNLMPAQRISIEIASMYFYYSLNKDSLSTLDMSLFSKKLQSLLGIKPSVTLEVIKNIDGKFDTIEDLVNVYKTIIGGLGADTLDKGLIYQLVAQMWYGYKAPSIMAVAVEHIPTWVSLCLAILSNKSYKHVNLFKVMDRYAKKGRGDKFTKNAQRYASNYIVE